MTSSRQDGPRYGRRIAILALVVVVALVGYAAAWHYVAGQIVERAGAAIAAVNRDGRRAACENLEVRGFPFRIGVFCRGVMYIDQRQATSLRAGAFRSAAQIYNPFHAIGELDGPASIEVPGLTALDLTWETLRASARIATPLEQLSVEARGLAVVPDYGPAEEAPLLTVETGELHLRPDGNHVDLAVRFAGLDLGEELVGDIRPPPLSGLVDARLLDAMSRLSAEDGLRGRSLVLRDARVSTEAGAGATLSGPVSVDTDGLIDAELRLSLTNSGLLAELLGDLFPDSRDEIAMAMGAIAASGGETSLPLRIEGGTVRLGFFVLGQIPPL